MQNLKQSAFNDVEKKTFFFVEESVFNWKGHRPTGPSLYNKY